MPGRLGCLQPGGCEQEGWELGCLGGLGWGSGHLGALPSPRGRRGGRQGLWGIPDAWGLPALGGGGARWVEQGHWEPGRLGSPQLWDGRRARSWCTPEAGRPGLTVVEGDDVEAVEQLALVLVDALHLDVEERVGVDLHLVLLLQVGRKLQLVLLAWRKAWVRPAPPGSGPRSGPPSPVPVPA